MTIMVSCLEAIRSTIFPHAVDNGFLFLVVRLCTRLTYTYRQSLDMSFIIKNSLTSKLKALVEDKLILK